LRSNELVQHHRHSRGRLPCGVRAGGDERIPARVRGGLWIDSLSANPLGISLLPLFLAGLFIQRSRDLVLRQQPFAQFVLGAAASAAVPVMTLLLLLNIGAEPLVSWFSLWQWVVMSLVGGAITPAWFLVFDRIAEALNYRALGETSFRADREIKRGRQ
jgi:hypothetical protein